MSVQNTRPLRSHQVTPSPSVFLPSNTSFMIAAIWIRPEGPQSPLRNRQDSEGMRDTNVAAGLALAGQRIVVGRFHREVRVVAVADDAETRVQQGALGQIVIGTQHEQVG